MAKTRNGVERYNDVAVALHWIIAGLILWQIWLGYNRSQPGLFDWHKAIGMLILLFSVARLAWRLVNPPPPLAGEVKRWELTLARLTHAGFYVAMIGLPLTGWIAVSTGRAARAGATTTPMAGGIDLPLLPADAALHGPSETVHIALVYLTFALLALHVAAALKHQFVDRAPGANRMPPFGVRGTRRPD